MNLQAERLSALIEFCCRSALLRNSPTSDIDSYKKYFSPLHESDLIGLPGVHLNQSRSYDKGEHDKDEIWLVVDRLHETKPPEVTNEWLRPWIVVAHGPKEEPILRPMVSGSSLINEGTHASEENEDGKPLINPEESINFNDYGESESVSVLFQDYIEVKWRIWSVEEKND